MTIQTGLLSKDFNHILQKETIAPMNIIFDLSSVFFDTHINPSCATQRTLACGLTPINPSMSMRLLFDCARNGNKLFLLSDITSEHFDFLSSNPQAKMIFNYFDEIIFTNSLNSMNDNSYLFNRIIDKYSLTPHQSIFINNQIVNARAAEQAGISKNILCSNFDFISIRKELKHHGAL